LNEFKAHAAKRLVSNDAPGYLRLLTAEDRYEFGMLEVRDNSPVNVSAIQYLKNFHGHSLAALIGNKKTENDVFLGNNFVHGTRFGDKVMEVTTLLVLSDFAVIYLGRSKYFSE